MTKKEERAGRGRRPYALSAMLRIHCVDLPDGGDVVPC